MQLRDIIGVGIVLSFILIIPALFLRSIPIENKEVVVYIIGQLSGFVGAVVAYHYTASKSDDAKTANTAKAFDAITATANANPAPEKPVDVTVVNAADNPVPTTEGKA